MPIFNDPIPNLEEAVRRPAVLSVVKQIMIDSQIPGISTIRFVGDMGEALEQHSTINNHDKYPLLFGQNSAVDITVEHEFQHQPVYWQRDYRFAHPPIWGDPILNVEVRPIYTAVKTIINFNYRAQSKDAAVHWMNALRNRMHDRPLQQQHLIAYEYAIPHSVLKAINHIYQLRENNAGYGETWEEYFNSNSRQRISRVSTLDGKTQHLAIFERQKRVHGIYDFYAEPKQGDRNEKDTWNISFRYIMEWDCPAELRMILPTFVHNQRIAREYLEHLVPGPNVFDPYTTGTRFSDNDNAVRMFDPTDIDNVESFKGVTIPAYDEFIEGPLDHNHKVFLTAACNIKDQQKNLMAISDLGDYKLDEELVELMKFSSGGMIGYGRRHPIHITVYQNEGVVDPATVLIDDDLKLTTTFPMSVRWQYRVRINVERCWQFLPEEMINYLRCKPKLLVKLLSFLGFNYQVGELDPCGCIKRKDFEKIIQDLDQIYEPKQTITFGPLHLQLIMERGSL